MGHAAQALAHQKSFRILIRSASKTVVMEVGGCHNSLALKMDRGLTRVAQCFFVSRRSWEYTGGST